MTTVGGSAASSLLSKLAGDYATRSMTRDDGTTLWFSTTARATFDPSGPSLSWRIDCNTFGGRIAPTADGTLSLVETGSTADLCDDLHMQEDQALAGLLEGHPAIGIDSTGAFVTLSSGASETVLLISSAALDGDPAVWSIDSGTELTSESRAFAALVTRLDCSGGVTGHVLSPVVHEEATRIVVTFAVEALGATETTTCQGNPAVPVSVDLDTAVGNRELIDGQCLPGGPAFGTGFCLDEGVRWTP
jgi:hypothetical protein